MNIYLPDESASLLLVVLLEDTGVVVFCVDGVKVNVIRVKVDSSVDLAVVISTVDGREEADTSVLVDTC